MVKKPAKINHNGGQKEEEKEKKTLSGWCTGEVGENDGWVGPDNI